MWEDLKSPAFKEGLIFLDTFGLSPEGAPENKLQITDLFMLSNTGCKRRIRKIFEFKIWRQPLLVEKQKLYQQKALDFNFYLTS